MSATLEHKRNLLLQAIPDTILHLNRQGVLLDFKPSSVRLYNLSESGIGKNIRGLLPAALADGASY